MALPSRNTLSVQRIYGSNESFSGSNPDVVIMCLRFLQAQFLFFFFFLLASGVDLGRPIFDVIGMSWQQRQAEAGGACVRLMFGLVKYR